MAHSDCSTKPAFPPKKSLWRRTGTWKPSTPSRPCKYAAHQIRVSAAGGGDHPLDILVEDDGPGVAPALRAAILQGTVIASYCCEGFGLKKTDRLKKTDLSRRLRELMLMVKW